jgi:hypothetical protein
MFGRIGVIELVALPALLCLGPKVLVFVVTGAMFARVF